MPATYDLTGKVAVVTGAAGGFGQAIVARLRSAGALVLRWDLSRALERDLLAEQAISYAVDVADEASVEAAGQALVRDHSRLDILINNAGIVGDVLATWEVSPSEFRRVIDVNLIGTFLVCRTLVPVMIESAARHGSGRIVNVASIQAKEGMHMAAAYSSAKAGVVALTKSLGKELAAMGILVNAITPAASLTGMSVNAPKERLAEILARIPMGRFLEPNEVAAMVTWLASDECTFSTGAVFDLSGGRATY